MSTNEKPRGPNAPDDATSEELDDDAIETMPPPLPFEDDDAPQVGAPATSGDGPSPVLATAGEALEEAEREPQDLEEDEAVAVPEGADDPFAGVEPQAAQTGPTTALPVPDDALTPPTHVPTLAPVADDAPVPPTTPPVARAAPAFQLHTLVMAAPHPALAPPPEERVRDAALDAGFLPDDTSIETLEEMPRPEPRQRSGPDIGRRKMLLGEMLLESGSIKEDQLEMALAEQRRTRNLLGEVLVSLGFVPEEVVAKTVSAQTGIPYHNLPPEPLPPQLLKLVPEDVARKHRLVALGVEGSILRLAMANPFDVVALDSIRTSTGLVPFPSITPWGQILKVIERNFAQNESFDESFERLIASAEARVGNDDDEDVTRGPLVELVDQLVVRAVEERATDIHIEPEELVIRIRYRIDSILQPGPMIPKKLQAGITARLKVMAGLNIAENRVPQDGRIRFAIKGRQIDLRISTFLCNYGENIVLRVLDKTSVVLSLERVGLLPDDLQKFEGLIDKPHGIILVTGPTGSGKTTTLYAALSKLNTIDVNIMTIEDPIEYELNLIRQSQVNLKAGITFATGLRALLRQDPDIILIGEMRDEETASMAVRAAMTGHLVFSTLHTNTAAGAINRIIDMKVEPLLVTDTVIAAIGQRLSRLVCPKCKELAPAPPERLKELERAAAVEKIEWDGMVAIPKGCPECRFRGYHGRAALFEIFEMTREAQDLVLRRQYGSELVRLARSQGMRTMYDDGLRRVLMKTHTLEELDRVIEPDMKLESGLDA